VAGDRRWQTRTGAHDVPVRLEDLTWPDWAPWLAELDGTVTAPLWRLEGSSGEWWRFERVGTTMGRIPVPELTLALAQIVGGRRSRFVDRLIGELLPQLPLHLKLSDLPQAALGGRALGKLRRMGLASVADLARTSPGELYAASGWGPVAMQGTFIALMESCLPGPVTSLRRCELAYAAERAVLDDLATLAIWQHLLGDGSAALLAIEQAPTAPAAVHDAAHRLRTLTAGTLMPDQARADPAVQLGAAAEALPEEHRSVLRGTLEAAAPPPPAVLARDLGVRRDHISEMERHGIARMRAALADGPAALAAEALERHVAEVEPVKRLVARFPVLGQVVPQVDAPVWRIVARVGGRVWEEDGWIGSAPIAYTVAQTRNRIADAGVQGAADTLDAVRDLLPASLERADAAAWLEYCQIAVTADGRITAMTDLADRLARELVRAGTPQHLDALAPAAPGYSQRTLAAVLASDDRFERERAGRVRFAMWGRDPQPQDVTEMIRAALNAAGGSIGVDELAAGLAARYGAAERDVRRLVAAVPFRVVDGTVRWFNPRTA
jgi:hypothetical protein